MAEGESETTKEYGYEQLAEADGNVSASDKRAEKLLQEASQKEQSAGSFLGKLFG